MKYASLFFTPMHMQSCRRNFREPCGLLHHKGSNGITQLGLEVNVRLQLWCD